MTKKVSISDIAKNLGVSKTLVSMVLNNSADNYGISQETQKRVLDKMQEMNYQPNQMARGLRLGKTNTIGLIVSDISNPFYSKLARHIEDIIAPHNINLILCSTDENPEKEIRLINMLRERQVEGLIISTSQKDHSLFATMIQEKFPFVLIDRYFPELHTNTVIVDNYSATFRATEYLLQNKYEQILFIGISPDYVSSIKHRIEGYKAALEKHHNNSKHLIFSLEGFETKFKNAILKNAKNDFYPDAIFAINNVVATKCLECLKHKHIKPGEDIGFICFDDLAFFKIYNPSISAIEQPIEEIAKCTVELLHNDISSSCELKKEFIELQTKLIIRESTTVLNK